MEKDWGLIEILNGDTYGLIRAVLFSCGGCGTGMRKLGGWIG